MEETVSIATSSNVPVKDMAIDTHVHFWNYDKIRDAWITDHMKILQQHYLPQTIAGTLRRKTGASVSSVAHRIGRVEFLLPDGVIVPESGLPPLTMRSAMQKGEQCGRSEKIGPRNDR